MELQGFPERLREAIAAADLTIAETAKLSGLALSTVQFYLSGRRDNPSGENVLALSTVLGCGAGWLLAGEGDAPTPAEALAAVERARKAPLQPAADAAPAEVAQMLPRDEPAAPDMTPRNRGERRAAARATSGKLWAEV